MTTVSKQHVTSAAEWAALPEPVLPKIKGPEKAGATFNVRKVGFVFATDADLDHLHLTPRVAIQGRPILPTTVVDFGDEPQLCRLPIELSQWALDAVAMARSGMLKFPTTVEFGYWNGRAYAEFI